MITSVQNERIIEISKLKDKKERDLKDSFLIEGPHLIKEAKDLGLELEVYSTNGEGTIVSEQVMKKITDNPNLVPCCAVVKKPHKEKIGNKVLILDRIQDPGNMGTLIRSAVSFGFETIVLPKGTVDPFSQKVVRSTQGGIFKINIIFSEIQPFLEKIPSHKVYGTALENGKPLGLIPKVEKMAIILGNEGQGIKKEILAKLDNIFIEMSNMESLNVGVAGSIIMYTLGERK